MVGRGISGRGGIGGAVVEDGDVAVVLVVVEMGCRRVKNKCLFCTNGYKNNCVVAAVRDSA